MMKKKVLTVGQYMDRRNPEFYGKRIRIIGADGTWLDNVDREVEKVKITEKWIFIYVKER